ncbi:hypothetical protein BD779DRAFT_1474705 [Infundibulicybe gibba]|nr:hypothetical protein BD779DRAFT_1474705 [Infundibulicybe gibba]
MPSRLDAYPSTSCSEYPQSQFPELHGLQGRHNLVYAVLSTSFPYFASQLQPAFMAPICIFLVPTILQLTSITATSTAPDPSPTPTHPPRQHTAPATETMTQTPGVPTEVVATPSPGTSTLVPVVCGPQYDALIDKSKWPKNKTFSFGPTTATGNMRRHLEKWHSKAVEKYRWSEDGQSSLLGTRKANPILLQSIYVVENKQFRKLLGVFRTDYTERNVPHARKFGPRSLMHGPTSFRN